MLGVTIGCAFLGITLKEFTETISHTLAFLVMVVAVTYAFAWTIEIVAGVSFVSALLAFAPGGQAEMSLVAAATGVNVAYVAVHHLIRIFLVLVCAPPLFSLIRRHRNRKQRPQT
ncbi:AbrB family transcriptional regulator [Marinobacterium aestuariivivens]|uniref:AbrB family transcriptional regulator n=1 Tax=Marinobacterium aestuariivivens TaxID=1698799 RepID=A0ABW2A9V9_9GAMM